MPEVAFKSALRVHQLRKAYKDVVAVDGLDLEVRTGEFIREPEALFWVFVFPILLAAGLGLAFRNRPADVLKIAVVFSRLAQSSNT